MIEGTCNFCGTHSKDNKVAQKRQYDEKYMMWSQAWYMCRVCREGKHQAVYDKWRV